ncbi:MAG: carbonic anhydrase, partial [Pseudomonadota bacterium]
YVGNWMAWLDKDVMHDALTHAHDHDQDPCPAAGSDDVDEQRYRAVEEAGIRQSIENLKTYPCVQSRLRDEKITLHGSWFDIEKGELWVMDTSSGEFHWTDGMEFR